MLGRDGNKLDCQLLERETFAVRRYTLRCDRDDSIDSSRAGQEAG
jgi:hypothetical protein